MYLPTGTDDNKNKQSKLFKFLYSSRGSFMRMMVLKKVGNKDHCRLFRLCFDYKNKQVTKNLLTGTLGKRPNLKLLIVPK